MRDVPTLVCAALPFGYGPAAKLLALCAEAAGDARLVFVGEGSSLELVLRSPGVFAEVVPVPAGRPEADERIARADAVLSVMDRAAGAAAARLRRPLHVLDSLLWMRARVPEELATAAEYAAQAFPGLDPAAYEPRPRVVGPVLRPPRPPPARREGLVVHLGGSAAPDDRRALYRAYAAFAVRAVEAAGLPRRFGRVTVLAGGGAADAARAAATDPAVRVESASPAAAGDRLAEAAAVLTAPGLTTTLEAFRDGTPTWFLPPQNHSQWCILRRLRAAGAADGALHWEDLPAAPRLRERSSPAETDPLVREAVLRFARDPAALSAATAAAARVGEDPPPRVAAQSAFFASLGADGAPAVVEGLRRELLGARAPRRAASVPLPHPEGTPR